MALWEFEFPFSGNLVSTFLESPQVYKSNLKVVTVLWATKIIARLGHIRNNRAFLWHTSMRQKLLNFMIADTKVRGADAHAIACDRERQRPTQTQDVMSEHDDTYQPKLRT